ncbi:hypothetical protein CBR_g48494 [Chara braunii]|uniref:CCR4-Not complex component Not N-terminal domain-containing protein n=1 Tax=Chara braunii TaxID=69332 RepID=A0A388M315_CHABU|nr:hypothetical protein CBR_g48494 [Chara braunii]|eukprot:GBG88882.1 hypothetical protein CBR_g48494 [Chara braunii]
MAAVKKMQLEIERTLKKVQEGSDVFQATWEKMNQATEASKKEKYEAELKKDLKKLQRYRDQIRSWLASPDARAWTESLRAARKQIESEMERFKVCERASKIKAFSKEGLVKQVKLDPSEQQKHEAAAFLNRALDSLQLQIDECEANIESIRVSGKAGRKASPQVMELEKTLVKEKEAVVQI